MADTPLGYYKWYPRDFYSSIKVRGMSFTARAIYRELLDLQWENGCLTSVQQMLNVLGITSEQWSEFAPYLDQLFPGGINERLDALRSEAIESQSKKAKAGKASAQSRLKSNTCPTPVEQVFNETETETETETTTPSELVNANATPVVVVDEPQEVKTPAKKFIKPSLEEVRAFMNELGSSMWYTEGSKFWNYYESKGWVVGRSGMKDWNAAARGWLSRSKDQEKSGGSSSPMGQAKRILQNMEGGF